MKEDYVMWKDAAVFAGFCLMLWLMVKFDARRKPRRRYHMVDQKRRRK